MVAQLTWFSQHIKTLEADKRVSIRLYITRPPTLEVVPLTPTEGASEKKHSETATITKDPEKELRLRSETHFSSDSEKGPQSDGDVPSPMDGMDTHIENVPIIYQRPEIQAIIRTEIDETPVNKRVLVMGCGPDSLMRAVRDTSADCIRTQGPAVEVHCEQFGW